MHSGPVVLPVLPKRVRRPVNPGLLATEPALRASRCLHSQKGWRETHPPSRRKCSPALGNVVCKRRTWARSRRGLPDMSSDRSKRTTPNGALLRSPPCGGDFSFAHSATGVNGKRAEENMQECNVCQKSIDRGTVCRKCFAIGLSKTERAKYLRRSDKAIWPKTYTVKTKRAKWTRRNLES